MFQVESYSVTFIHSLIDSIRSKPKSIRPYPTYIPTRAHFYDDALTCYKPSPTTYIHTSHPSIHSPSNPSAIFSLFLFSPVYLGTLLKSILDKFSFFLRAGVQRELDSGPLGGRWRRNFAKASCRTSLH